MELRARKRFRAKEERRPIGEETLKPGASGAVVARAHDVNANQVFHWRKLYRAGWFDEPGLGQTQLLPVKISNGAEKLVAAHRSSKKAQRRSRIGHIEIDLGHARIRIEGAADLDCVRA